MYNKFIKTKKGSSELFQIVKGYFGDRGFKLNEDNEQKVMATTGINIFSWGERITVEYISDDLINISSECKLSTQILDWGKNKRNVMSVIELLTD